MIPHLKIRYFSLLCTIFIALCANEARSEPVCYIGNERGEIIDLSSLCVDKNSTALKEKYLAEVTRFIKQNSSPNLVDSALRIFNDWRERGRLQDEGEKFCAAWQNGNSLQAFLERQYQMISSTAPFQRDAIELVVQASNQAAITTYCPGFN